MAEDRPVLNLYLKETSRRNSFLSKRWPGVVAHNNLQALADTMRRESTPDSVRNLAGF